MLDTYQDRASFPEVVRNLVRIEGAGAANPDKEVGRGVTVTWVSTGRYRFVWAENPGQFLGLLHGFQATTPANVDGWTAVAGDYNSTTRTLDVYVYSDTPALADLAATQKLFLEFNFARTSLSG